jgi:cytochrome d ubiquinol oxidase subunit I
MCAGSMHGRHPADRRRIFPPMPAAAAHARGRNREASMDPLIAARAQMAFSLGFHMVFAALGIGLPLLMMVAEGRWLRTGLAHWRELARTWSKAAALTFVIGAVSGTALSFELGLSWPRFMAAAGATIGPAFALEGFAFFIEAIFLGLYVYGWERLSPRAHWWTGVVVAASGMLSGVLVVAANAWMQHPAGASVAADGTIVAGPGALFGNPAWLVLALHSTLACYSATGFAVAGVYARRWLRGRRDAYVRAALGLAVAVGGLATLLQPLAGDLCAQLASRQQPVKFAAMEAHFASGPDAALIIGGWPDAERGEVRGGLRIPWLLSLLAHHDPHAEVVGLDRAPRDQWPDVALTHLAFDAMVASGLGLIALAGWYALAWRRGRLDPGRGLHRTLVAAAPLGFLALEAGWVVTEVGRQPWIVQGLMRTAQAVTPAPGVVVTCAGFALLYLVLGAVLVSTLLRLGRARGDEVHHAP